MSYNVWFVLVTLLIALPLAGAVAIDTTTIRVTPARHRAPGRASYRRKLEPANEPPLVPVEWVDVPGLPDGAVMAREERLRDFAALRELAAAS